MQVLRVEITVVHGETMLPILLRSVQLLFSRVSSTPTGRTPFRCDPLDEVLRLAQRRGARELTEKEKRVYLEKPRYLP